MQTILKYLLYMHVAQHITELIVRMIQIVTLMVTEYESMPSPIKSIITKNYFGKSQNHSIDKELLKMLKILTMDLLIGTYELYYGIWGWFWVFSEQISLAFGYTESNEVFPTTVFLTFLCVWSSTKELPINSLENLIKGDFRDNHEFMKQELKALAHKLTLVPVFCGVLYFSVFKYHSSILWLSLALGVCLFIGHFLYSIFIEPTCLKYEPLQDDLLKQSMETMLEESGFGQARIYVTQRPTKCTFRNVQIFGFWKFKKVVLFQNFMKYNLSNEEILAVVSHELGHWKKWHMWIWFAVVQEIILADIITSMLILRCRCIFKAIGLSCFSRPTIVALLISKIFVSGSFTVRCLNKFMLRCFEYQADNFAKEQGHGHYLANALIKISNGKKEFPVSSNIYMYSLLAQPTLLKRINFLVNEKDE